MHSLASEYLAALHFDGTQAAMLRISGEYQGKQQVYAAQSPGVLNAAGRYATALDQHLADPLELVPLATLDFRCIHPFPDGNGRMSRLLTLLLLYYFDYAVGRYISLVRILEETKEGYYEALVASSRGWHQDDTTLNRGSTTSGGALLRTYREFEERVGTIEYGRGSKGDRVRAEVLGRTLPFSISEIKEACTGVSRDMVRLVLRAMKSRG